MHSLVTLAIHAVEHYIETGKSLPCPDPLPESMQEKSGTFVSIKKHGSLRGCIGTMTPKYKNLAEEVIQNAVRAANHDPRFDSIKNNEIDSLTFTVDILEPLEKIENLEGHNPKQFGLAVRGGGKQGILLPDLENIKSADQQLKVCLKKGRFISSEPYDLFRFEVKRLK